MQEWLGKNEVLGAHFGYVPLVVISMASIRPEPMTSLSLPVTPSDPATPLPEPQSADKSAYRSEGGESEEGGDGERGGCSLKKNARFSHEYWTASSCLKILHQHPNVPSSWLHE